MNEIIATQAQQLLEADEAILIDVRDADEFAQEHIAYARSIPLKALFDELSKLNLTDKKIIFQCKKGARGMQACDLAEELAVRAEVFNMLGGIEAWKERGLPVISNVNVENNFKLSLMQQTQILMGLFIVLFIAMGSTGLSIAYIFAAFIGIMMMSSAITGWCGLAIVLNKMPWNKRFPHN